MSTLETYRKEIDQIDKDLMALLVRRFEIVEMVGQYKAQNDIAVVQSERAMHVIERAKTQAEKHGIPGRLLETFYTDMIDHAHKIEHAMGAQHKADNKQNTAQ